MKASLYAVVGIIASGSIFALLMGSVMLAHVDDVLSSSDEMTLSDGLAMTVELVNGTAAVGRPMHFVPVPDNADPKWTHILKNNHSIFDNSNPQQYPGYNDCDSWENLVHDGWSATYAVRAPIASGQAIHLLDAVSRYWHSRGYTIQTLTHDQGQNTYSRLFIDLEFTQIQFNADPRRGEVMIRGITDCLPPS